MNKSRIPFALALICGCRNKPCGEALKYSCCEMMEGNGDERERSVVDIVFCWDLIFF